MRIKVAFLDSNTNYLNRLVTVFASKYSEKLQTYSFTDLGIALSNLQKEKIDVLICSEDFELSEEHIPNRCGVAYFVDDNDIATFKGYRAIGRYQKADAIYKQILSIYAENAGAEAAIKMDDDSSRVVVFSSPCGGCGNSSMAAACAISYARKGKKVLYLNLEKLGGSDSFFAADGVASMSDVVFSLKSRKTNLLLKLESFVRQDHTGVSFFAKSKIALDMLELSSEEQSYLVSTLQLSGLYDVIVVDVDFEFQKSFSELYKNANAIVWVSSSSDVAIDKINRAYASIVTKEQDGDERLSNRIMLIYNMFSNKTGMIEADKNIYNIGGVQRFDHATTSQVVDLLSKKAFFDNILT